MTLPKSWWIYKSQCEKPDPSAIEQLPSPPPWRSFGAGVLGGATFQATDEEAELVNAAILLRRPLLVTGKPGCGKTSLAKSVAWQLGLEPLLVWSINTRSTLTDGLYRYDAIARLQDASLRGHRKRKAVEISKYLRLGPLGEALAATGRPKILLIDEIDKSDVDLPNDLLHVLEEGYFEIPELKRLEGTDARLFARVGGGSAEVELPSGEVRCKEFPIVIMTSNGEREFPPAFLRRCIQLHVTEPDEQRLHAIVAAHLRDVDQAVVSELIDKFLKRRHGTLATDQLLNAVYLATTGGVDFKSQDELLAAVFRALSAERTK